jgi:hypothetical protein
MQTQPMAFEEMTLGGEVIHLIHRRVPIGDIEYDEDNPRLRYLSEMNGGGMTAEQLLAEIGDAPKLRKDIEMAGDLRERVILRPNGKNKFKAVEGNRRRYAFGELHAKYPDDQRWLSMPARILPESIDERKVALLLSDMHVVGKVKWDAAEKAGQIFKMNRELGIPLDEIVVHLHASKATVIRWLKAYTFLHERYRKIDNGKYDKNAIDKWSWIDEAFRSPVLRPLMEDDPGFGDKFCRWVGDGRLSKGEQVRRLAAIMANSTAFQAFETLPTEKAFNEAIRIVATAEPEQDSDLFKLLAKVRQMCTEVGSIREINRLRDDAVAQQRFRETVMAMRSFAETADVELE